jgi:hypothetical protein
MRGQKRALPESTEAFSMSHNSGQDEPEDGLKMWGYMPGHLHYNLSCSDGDVSFALPVISLPDVVGLATKRITVRVRQIR